MAFSKIAIMLKSYGAYLVMMFYSLLDNPMTEV